MPTSILTFLDKCIECDSPLADALHNCPTCMADVGAPNVRSSCLAANLKVLNSRYEEANIKASASGISTEFESFKTVLEEESGVVIGVPPNVASDIFSDTGKLYANYEKLVEASARNPASSENDKRRLGVGGTLFGSYAKSIMYGALSINGKGVSTYGPVLCKLRDVAIRKRTSFLEMNSYKFVKQYSVVAGEKIPDGYTSCWDDRYKLALVKLVDNISKGCKQPDFPDLLLQSDGQNSDNDEFIEAHIYGGFDGRAVDSITIADNVKIGKKEQLDCDLAVANFSKIKGHI